MVGARVRTVLGAALGLALVAGLVPPDRPAEATAAGAAEPQRIDDGAAPPAWLDASILPMSLRPRAGRARAATVETIRPNGSFGFLPFDAPSHDFGAYRFQLVSSGSDGDVESIRSVVVAAAGELTRLTGITSSVDGGQVPRPGVVNRFGSRCSGGPGHRCSYFDDGDTNIGIIRIGFSDSSPCGTLVPAGTAQGVVGCGGPESVRTDDGTVFHVRGNVWLSGSLQDVNASISFDIVTHEIGHAVGLDHFSPAYTAIPGGTPVRQLMYPSVHQDPSDTGSRFRSGDVHGLWWLHLPEAWYITATYRDFLGRRPDTSGYHYWLGQSAPRDVYVGALATSDEWVGRIVTDFYGDVFGRSPDPSGFTHWAGLIKTRGVPFVAAQLYGSQEYLLRNGGTTTGFVQGMYRELLGRDPATDGAGVAYWTAEADRQGRTVVAFAFFESQEKRRARVRDLYCTLLDRPPDDGGLAYWADVILLQGDLALARNLATSFEYESSADEFALKDPSAPPAPGC